MRPVARIGDKESPHCSAPSRMEGSFNVFANGIPVSRLGDSNTPHTRPCPPHPCCGHVHKLVTGSATVFANGIPLGRVGDKTGCRTVVVQGSPNVFAGG